MKIYPPFPTCREATPTRRAEKLIYEALEASDLDGLALYEVKPLSSAPQLDFAVWLLDVGTFGIQTKRGRYIIIDGEWYLVTDRGRIRKESPIPGTWDAAMAIHDWVQEQLRHKTFVIPVLVLTDMEPDAEIEALAAARNVVVHWGSPDNLVEHLVEDMARSRRLGVGPGQASHGIPDCISSCGVGITRLAMGVGDGRRRWTRRPGGPFRSSCHCQASLLAPGGEAPGASVVVSPGVGCLEEASTSSRRWRASGLNHGAGGSSLNWASMAAASDGSSISRAATKPGALA